MAEQIKDARLDRMVTDAHICPFGLKSVDLLKREGFAVEDHELRSREETYVFKRRHDIETTPQTFIDGKRIGGYDDLRRHFGRSVRDPSKVTYRPVTAVFAMVLLTVLAAATPRSARSGPCAQRNGSLRCRCAFSPY